MTSDGKDFIALIPQYLSEQLSEEAKAEFETALANDAVLLRELEEFKELQDLCREAIVEPERPSEKVFSRVLDQIEAGEESAAEPSAAAGYREINYTPSATVRISEFWSKIKDSLSIPWSLALVQAAVIILLVFSKPPENTYNTLGTTPQTSTGTEQIILNIVFADSAREADIRNLLLQIDGTIIDGPSTQGRYQVSVAKEKMDNQALIELQQSELISFAEQVL